MVKTDTQFLERKKREHQSIRGSVKRTVVERRTGLIRIRWPVCRRDSFIGVTRRADREVIAISGARSGIARQDRSPKIAADDTPHHVNTAADYITLSIIATPSECAKYETIDR